MYVKARRKTDKLAEDMAATLRKNDVTNFCIGLVIGVIGTAFFAWWLG